MLCFVTDRRPGEPDLMAALRMETLKVVDLDGGAILAREAPAGGWTHDELERIAVAIEPDCLAGADAFLGPQWVGSTEV